MTFLPKARSNGASTMVYGHHLLHEFHKLEEPMMDLGVRLCYLIWCSQDRWDKDRKIYADVVKNIYPELAKASPLFSYWERSGVRADDVIKMLTHESTNIAQ